jgi:hypothetical protein
MLRMNRMMLAVVFAAGCLGSAPQGKTGTGTDPNGTNTTDPNGNNSNSSSNSNSSNPAANPNDPSANTDPNLGLAPTDTSGGENNTFDHDNTAPDPFEVLAKIQDEGAPEISTRMHSCSKMKYATLGNLLTALGVNLAKTGTPMTAGQLYKGGGPALGMPNFGARVREALESTTASDTKLFDIFAQAAPEIIAAMPNAALCKVAGASTSMFDTNGNCTQAGVSCLQGAPATQAQVDLCTTAITSGSTTPIGQAIAVASILAASHTCE